MGIGSNLLVEMEEEDINRYEELKEMDLSYRISEEKQTIAELKSDIKSCEDADELEELQSELKEHKAELDDLKDLKAEYEELKRQLKEN